MLESVRWACSRAAAMCWGAEGRAIVRIGALGTLASLDASTMQESSHPKWCCEEG